MWNSKYPIDIPNRLQHLMYDTCGAFATRDPGAKSTRYSINLTENDAILEKTHREREREKLLVRYLAS